MLSFEDQFGHAVVATMPQRYRELVMFLRDEPELAFDYCDFTAGVDLGEDGMEVVTHLHSTSLGHDARVKVRLPAVRPRRSSAKRWRIVCHVSAHGHVRSVRHSALKWAGQLAGA